MNNRGSNRPKGAPGLPGAGRPPATATLREGIIVYVSQVLPGGNVDLGHGLVASVERLKGGDRCVVIPQKDGSELRIVIGENN